MTLNMMRKYTNQKALLTEDYKQAMAMIVIVEHGFTQCVFTSITTTITIGMVELRFRASATRAMK